MRRSSKASDRCRRADRRAIHPPEHPRREGSAKGSGSRMTARSSEKTAVVPPIPSASVRIAASVKPGRRASVRTVWRRSLAEVVQPAPSPGVAALVRAGEVAAESLRVRHLGAVRRHLSSARALGRRRLTRYQSRRGDSVMARVVLSSVRRRRAGARWRRRCGGSRRARLRAARRRRGQSILPDLASRFRIAGAALTHPFSSSFCSAG